MNAYYEYDNDVFRDKVILCPCDDPEWSNFTKYFVQNFERFGLKKLISTSYAQNANGKFRALTKDTNKSGCLEGNGDFRSEEVTKLRDEADIIITNEPFSLCREFVAWLFEGKVQFAIIANMNAITYKEIFPLLKENKMWLGTTHPKEFIEPDGSIKKFGNILWFTNIDHNLRHEKLKLMTMRENLKYNKKLKKKFENDYGVLEYPKYDNYDAIEVPFVDAIPRDYVPCWFNCEHVEDCPWALSEGLDSDRTALCEDKNNGCMGVPITYLDKHTLNQFDIIGVTESEGKGFSNGLFSGSKVTQPIINRPDQTRRIYKRIFIRQKKCNGVIGVPVTFLNKINLDQFRIIGLDRYTVPKEALVGGRVAINGKSCYARILIQIKKG